MDILKKLFQSKPVKIGLFGLALAASSVSAKTGQVTAKGLQIRAGPSTSSTALGSISNTKVKILDSIQKDGILWHKILVQTQDGTKTQAYIAGQKGDSTYVQVDAQVQKVNLYGDFDMNTPTMVQYANFISQWEGFSEKSYIDPQKSSDKTLYAIGYGTLLDNKTTLAARLRHLGLDKEKLIDKSQSITEIQARFLLIEEVKDAIPLAKKFAPNFDTLPKELKLILVDMSYNLSERLFKFKNLQKALASHDYQTASLEMKDSNWYSQVGQRSKHHVHVTYNLGQTLLASNKDIPKTNI